MNLTAQQYAELMPDGSLLLSDEPEMDSSLHWSQLELLVSCLEQHWRGREDYFIGADISVYYSRQQLLHRELRGPDFFLVKGTERRPRNSWVVWEEQGRYPDLIIELLSNSTEQVDRTAKKQLYQESFRTPEYFWFHPETLELAGFRLVDGVYRPILGDDRDWRYSEQLGLYLGVHDGQLRYFGPDGGLIATSAETALAEARRAQELRAEVEQARAETERERLRAEALAARLRSLGIEPGGD